MTIHGEPSVTQFHPVGQSLSSLLTRQAAVTPNNTAIVSADRTMTFQDLQNASGQLARVLMDVGLKEDELVGVFVDPSAELVVGVWGALAAGAAYLPLSPDYPDERLRYMIQDSKSSYVVAQPHLVARLRELAPRSTTIVEFAIDSSPLPAGWEARPSTAASLAYVIYTSGSTGLPKGVMIEQGSIASQMQWLNSTVGLQAGSTVLQKTPASFDAAQWEILSLAFGARLIMGSPGIYRDVEALVQSIKTHHVTILQCVPTLLQALTDHDDFRQCESLRHVLSGGELLSNQLARAFHNALPKVRLTNLYGPTESTINATSFLVDPVMVPASSGSIPIGRAVDNTQCFVLDEHLKPVPEGETGELHIGGIQVARGYIHRPTETAQKFIREPISGMRLYKTGDLARFTPDGELVFIGRTDNQVKLRGHRIELDEVSTTIEEHPWVRRAASVLRETALGRKQLISFIELNPREAALMDQGNHGSHHQSKAGRIQVKAQLAGAGRRISAPVNQRARNVRLPGKVETAQQRRDAFARKSYRYYEGADVTEARLLELLAVPGPSGRASGLHELTARSIGDLLRPFGQFLSDERLLPKYAYASPGALYATQMYVELESIADIADGIYYYDPVEHRLVFVGTARKMSLPRLQVHFVGVTKAIEPVYRNNIREVLELEAGHMVGLFENVLSAQGLGIEPSYFRPNALAEVGEIDSDDYLGTFDIVPDGDRSWNPPVRVLVQVHPAGVRKMSPGQYEYTDGALKHVSDQLVLAKDVIAINQAVYARASFGLSLMTEGTQDWLTYVSLGAALHRLQSNRGGLGLMSSGYSSMSGNPLPSARRLDEILANLGIRASASYFAIGGGVSDSQQTSEGMYEDAVHMKGPAELIKEQLARTLPGHMIPDRIMVLDHLPVNANGKLDTRALVKYQESEPGRGNLHHRAATTRTEHWLVDAWQACLKLERVSVDEDFFGAGGNSLMAVSLINRINRELGCKIPYQALFLEPMLSDLAARIDRETPEPVSRLAPRQARPGRPIVCWPGLGGYPMNLRHLAERTQLDRRFYGMQALGLNPDETPPATISDMAAADIMEIRRLQPEGPYTLIGYSFGARVAFETAWQLECLGEEVSNLILVCPGNPAMRTERVPEARVAAFENPIYVSVLFSVFSGTAAGEDLDLCLATCHDEDTFTEFIVAQYPALDAGTVRRITRIVSQTFEFDYTFTELTDRRVNAQTTILKARGDDYSFIESQSQYSALPPTVINLDGDHYSVLTALGVDQLASYISTALALEDFTSANVAANAPRSEVRSL